MQLLDRSKALKITPFLRLGFRPFFFLGALLAAVAVPLWLLALNGYFVDWQPTGNWLAWHRHELLFGFVGAIIAGFLLTAVQTWTGVPGLSGNLLLGLTLIWVAARLAWFVNVPEPVFLILNGLFFPLVALQMARSVWPVRQVRNYPLVLVLLVLSALNAVVLFGVVNADEALQRQAVLGGVWAVGAIMCIIGGRVIPFFTQRGLLRPHGVQAWPWLEHALLYGTLLIVLCYAGGWALQRQAAIGALFLLLAVGHLIRLARWYDQGIWRVPLLWSLHVATLWFVIAFFSMALWNFGWLANVSLAVHALTVGAMAGLILAMIARVTLGHTGRMLVPPKAMIWGFVLFNIAAVSRVFLVELNYQAGLGIAVLCWSISFAIYLYCYGPMLWKARVDGAPG
ncbi:MAG: NnrS family protein [Gammaproteobacteria bacterium]|nr:NnrS family protein [Gammaproteobacteria bacterium]